MFPFNRTEITDFVYYIYTYCIPIFGGQTKNIKYKKIINKKLKHMYVILKTG